MIVNGDGAILGRISAKVAKELLKGKEIIIVNAQNVIITGNPKVIKKDYLYRRHRGDRYKGPFFPRYPDAILRRTIRGMLPYKIKRGSDAMGRLKVHNECPEKFKESVKITKTLEEIKCKYITLRDLSRHLGAKV